MSFESDDPSGEVLSEINMTPLVDVLLVLLIIFMVTLPVMQHAVTVELPRARSAQATPPPSPLTLSVSAQGQFLLGQQAVAADALEATLRSHATSQPPPPLYIQGDRHVPYEQVAQALAAAHRAGLQKISLVTEGRTP